MREALEKSCNVYFYTLGNLLGVDRIHKWATALGLGEMSGIDLPHETQGIMPSTAWKKQRTGEKWYAGETISVCDRAGPGVGDADLAGRDDGVGGQRRHAHRAAPGARRRQRQGLGAAAAPRRASAISHMDADARDGRARGALDGGQRRRHRRPRPDRRLRRRRQDRHRAGHLEPGQGARQGRPRPARPRLVRVLRARPTTRRSPAWCSPSTPNTAIRRRRSPST